MANARPRSTTRSPRNTAWRTGLTPRQRDFTDRWLAEAGPNDFAAISSAYASAQRKPGPDYLKQRWHLLLDMGQLHLSTPSSSAFAVARKVASIAKATKTPDLPSEDSLRRWLSTHYPQQKAKLAAQVRREMNGKMVADVATLLEAAQTIRAALRHPTVLEWSGNLHAAEVWAAFHVEVLRQGMFELLRTSVFHPDPPRQIADI